MSDLMTVPRPEEVVVEPRSGRRKAKALLAGGLVLGIGAAITLAAWNDSEWAGGLFQGGTFKLEGSVDGGTYAPHDEMGEAAVLTFEPVLSNLAPDSVTSAAFAVRLEAGTTYDASVTINALAAEYVNDTPTVIPSVPGLSYEMVQTEAFGCDQGTTGTLIGSGQPVGTAPGGAAFALSQGAGGEAGNPVYVCVKVTADSAFQQGSRHGAVWQFLATST